MVTQAEKVAAQQKQLEANKAQYETFEAAERGGGTGGLGVGGYGSRHYTINLEENLGVGDSIGGSVFTLPQTKTVMLSESLALNPTAYSETKKQSQTVKEQITKIQDEIKNLERQREIDRQKLEAERAYYSNPRFRYDEGMNRQLEGVARSLQTFDARFDARIGKEKQKLASFVRMEGQLQVAAQKQKEGIVLQTSYQNPDYVQKDTPAYRGEKRFVQPQDVYYERPKAQTGVKEKLFASPGFAQKGTAEYEGVQPRQKESIAYTLGLTEDGQLAPKSFAVSLSEGKPPKPRELTQEQVNALSPQEYAAYFSEFEPYNKYVDSTNKQITEIKKANKIIAKGNLANWKKYKNELGVFIEKAKASGATTITINTKAGIEIVPIDKARNRIIRSRDVIGIGAIPTIPEGNIIGGNLTNYPESLVLISEPKIIKQDIKGKITTQYGFDVPPQPSTLPDGPAGFFTKVGQRATQMAQSKNPIQQTFGAFGQVGVETFAGLVYLESIGGKAFADFVNGTTNQTLGIPKQITAPETAPGLFISGLSTGTYAAAVSKSPTLFVSSAKEAFIKAEELAKKQGIIPTIAQTAGYIAPVNPSIAIKSFPLRYTKLVVPIGKGLGKTATIESATIARQLKFGYGQQLGRVGVGFGGGKIFVGLPKPERLPLKKIAYTAERGGYRITEGSSGVFMTRPQTLQQLVKLGKLEPEGAELITAQKEATGITGKIKDVPLRKTLTPTGLEQPQASLLAGKETKGLEKLVVSGQSRRKQPTPAVKGSVINQFFDIQPRQRRDIDIDVGMTKKNLKEQELFGLREAKRITEGMQALAGEGRRFVQEGRSVEVLTKDGAKKKVLEFVTERESLDYGKGFKSDPDVVFGFKVPRKVIQPGGKGTYKMLGYRFQGLRKTSSILELGGDMRKKAGQFLGVSKGREKDIRDNIEYLLTKAEQAKSEREAIKLKETAILTERFARARGWMTGGKELVEFELSDVEPPNLIRSIGNTARKGTGLGLQAASKPAILTRSTESDIEGITGKKRQRIITTSSPSISTKFQRSVGNKSVSIRSPSLKSVSVGSKRISLEPNSPSTSFTRSQKSLSSPTTIPEEPYQYQTISPVTPKSSGFLSVKPSPSFTNNTSLASRSPSEPRSPGVTSPAFILTPSPFVKLMPVIPIIPVIPFELFPKNPPKTFFTLKIGSETKKEKTKGSFPNDFIGNVSEEEIELGFNRREITTGIKRSATRLKKDLLFSRKREGYTKLVTQKTGNFLSKRKKSILEREKPKEVKRRKRKTGGFF